MPERFLRLGEAAKILDCSVDSLRRYEAQGLIAYQRMLGMRVLTEADIQLIRARRATFRRWRGKEKLNPRPALVEA